MEGHTNFKVIKNLSMIKARLKHWSKEVTSVEGQKKDELLSELGRIDRLEGEGA